MFFLEFYEISDRIWGGLSFPWLFSYSSKVMPLSESRSLCFLCGGTFEVPSCIHCSCLLEEVHLAFEPCFIFKKRVSMIFFKGAQINTTYPTEIVLGIFTNVN